MSASQVIHKTKKTKCPTIYRRESFNKKKVTAHKENNARVLSVQLLCIYLIMTMVILPQAEIWVVYPL